MIPTKQTVLHDPENGKTGNCFSAVLASLLHLRIEEVPLFAESETWVSDLNHWLKQFGLAYIALSDFGDSLEKQGISGLWHEVVGNTRRSHDVLHSCVGSDGQVCFDPHPDDSGLTGVVAYGVFLALAPWRNARRAGSWIERLSEPPETSDDRILRGELGLHLVGTPMRKLAPLDPTPEMIDAGAQRLVRWEDGCVWPDSWSELQVGAARTEAERVWRSMWLEYSEE